MKNTFAFMLLILLCIAFTGCKVKDPLASTQPVADTGVPSTSTSAETIDPKLQFIVDPVTSDVTVYANGATGDIVIPASYNGAIVTTIADGGFSGSTVTSVTIPDTVTKIGDAAFQNCKQLKNVTFGRRVAIIGKEAFSECSALEAILLPDSVTEYGEAAFKNCTAVKELQLSERATVIPKECFNRCYQVEEVHIPASVTELGQSALLAKNIYISGEMKLQTITGYPFAHFNCSTDGTWSADTWTTHIANVHIPNIEWQLDLFSHLSPHYSMVGSSWNVYIDGVRITEVTVPEGYSYVDRSLSAIEGLQKVILPSTLTEIKECAFHGRASLKEVVLPEGLVKIGERAFTSCKALETLIIPEGVVSIGESAFHNCKSLSTVSLPSTFTTIDSLSNSNIFSGCVKLKEITVSPENPVIGGDGESIWFKESGVLISAYDHFPDTPITSCFQNIFRSDEMLEQVIVPGITDIPDSLDLDAERIIISEGTETIGHIVSQKVQLYVVLPKTLRSFSNWSFKKETPIYYSGTAEEFEAVEIRKESNINPERPKKLFFYSETEPTEEGNYWHWVDGEAVIW